MRLRMLKAMTFWAKLQKPLTARSRSVQGHWATEVCSDGGMRTALRSEQLACPGGGGDIQWLLRGHTPGRGTDPGSLSCDTGCFIRTPSVLHNSAWHTNSNHHPFLPRKWRFGEDIRYLRGAEYDTNQSFRLSLGREGQGSGLAEQGLHTGHHLSELLWQSTTG